MYVRFNDSGQQIELAYEPYTNDSWLLIPEDLEFDLGTDLVVLIDGKLSKIPKPPYVAPPHYQINEYISQNTDLYEWPGDFPFDILGFQTKSFVALGLRRKTLYYSDVEMTDAIVKVEYEFVLDEGKSSMNRSPCTISFRMSDGSWSVKTKNILRTYNTSLEKQRELEARRNNIVDQLKGLAEQMGLLAQMTKLFEDYGAECFQYLKSGSSKLREAIQNDTKTPWLDANLPNGKPARAAITEYLSVGLI